MAVHKFPFPNHGILSEPVWQRSSIVVRLTVKCINLNFDTADLTTDMSSGRFFFVIHIAYKFRVNQGHEAKLSTACDFFI
jgi:hypothetical protein